MGMFDVQCMVSQLPITSDDPSVGLFLWNMGNDISLSGPFSLCSPLGGPVFGLCDGYGGIESESDAYHEWLLSEFNKAFDKKKYAKPEGECNFKSIGELMTHAWRDDEFGIQDLATNDKYSTRPCHITHCLMHKWAWEYIVSLGSGALNSLPEEIDMTTYALGLLDENCRKKEKTKEHVFAWALSPLHAHPYNWGTLRFAMSAGHAKEIPELDQSVVSLLQDKFEALYAFVFGLYRTERKFEFIRHCNQTHDKKAIVGLYKKSLAWAKSNLREPEPEI